VGVKLIWEKFFSTLGKRKGGSSHHPWDWPREGKEGGEWAKDPRISARGERMVLSQLFEGGKSSR